jgi:hypothetical protein
MGEQIKNYLGDVKESTLKIIEAEFAKVTPLKKGEFVSSREAKGDAAEEVEASGGGGGLDLPREDISKKLKPSILEKFKDKAWQKKVECATDIKGILVDAKMNITPDGLGPVMQLMTLALKESNKAVAKAFMSLLGDIAEAVGEPMKGFQKKCLVPMI